MSATATLEKPPAEPPLPQLPSMDQKVKLGINGELHILGHMHAACRVPVICQYVSTQSCDSAPGFGRIGRLVLRAALARDDIEVPF